ncbi:hypothetical protein [Bartonella sp. WD12.1]|uniref:hypothetical protein n=1 Tax=Bartonella sp. WD12.1 TaxID=1933903 RepID=UPI000999D599|nr:hypothetical protein [Bartonella sp. WD12.1]
MVDGGAVIFRCSQFDWLAVESGFSEESSRGGGKFCVVGEGLCVVEETCVRLRGVAWHSEEGHVVRKNRVVAKRL